MAYKIKELEQQAIKVIKSKKLKTFEDVIAFLPLGMEHLQMKV